MHMAVFSGGFAAGLLVFFAVYGIKSKVLHDVLDALGSVVLLPVKLIVRSFSQRVPDAAVIEMPEEVRSVVDEREQHLNDTAHAIRTVLLSLTQLANRAYSDEKLTEMVKLRQRYDD